MEIAIPRQTEKKNGAVRNNSIDIFRYVCAIMVVSIHSNPFYEISEGFGWVFSNVVPRIAVPFFFCVSGFFYFIRLEEGQTPFVTYVKRLLTTYFLWSLLYDVIYFISWGYSEPVNFLKKCAINFLWYGTEGHFWFFPALIISVCLGTVIYKLGGVGSLFRQACFYI